MCVKNAPVLIRRLRQNCVYCQTEKLTKCVNMLHKELKLLFNSFFQLRVWLQGMLIYINRSRLVNGPMRTRGPYTDKRPPWPRSSYIQGAHTDKRPLQRMCNSYTQRALCTQFKAPRDNQGPLQTRDRLERKIQHTYTKDETQSIHQE